jgi:hypothetical protein
MWRMGMAILCLLGTMGIDEGSFISTEWESGETEPCHYGTNGTLETSDRIYEYGYSKSLVDGDYDGLLRVMDKATGEVLQTLVYETGYLETFLFMGEYSDGTFVLALARYYLPEGSLMIRKQDTRLVKVDKDGVILLEKTLPSFQEDFHNHGGRLIVRDNRNSTEMTVYDEMLEVGTLPDIPESVSESFSYQFVGTATVNGEEALNIELSGPGIFSVSIIHGTYSYAFSIQVDGLLEGVEPNGEYTEPIRIAASGEVELDGETWDSGTEIVLPGYHRLIIRGPGGYERSLDFTLHPTVEVLHSGEEYSEPITLFSNGTAMRLDGEPAENGTEVWIAGDHRLSVEGWNGYLLEIPFTLLPTVSGVEGGKTYSEPIELVVNGGSSLDGETLAAGTVRVTDPGDHELILWNGTDRIETIHFTLQSSEKPIETEEKESVFPYWETGLGIVVLIGLFLVLKKK